MVDIWMLEVGEWTEHMVLGIEQGAEDGGG